MNKTIRRRLIRTLVLSTIALVIGGGVGYYQLKFQNARVISKGSFADGKPLPVAGLDLGGPFSLSDHTGAAVSEKTYDGHYKLIYFGFTYCPAICPTELQKISQVMRALEKKEPALAAKTQPLFITVDPQRDTIAIMKDYVSLFHPKLIGLTGTQPQVDFVTKAYRIFARKVETEEQQEYTMDHSSYIYLMGPENDLMALYRIDDGADHVYKDLTARLKADAP